MLTTLMEKTKERLDEYQIRYGLAQACLAKLRTCDENQNSILYALLTHLSKVPELDIDMVDFDYLQISLDGDLDNRAYDTAIVKLDSLQLLLSRMIVERNKNDVEQT